MHIEPLEPRTLLDAGGLDPYFGNDGIVTMRGPGQSSRGFDLATDNAGRIFVATLDSSNRLRVSRLRSDGSVDSSFGGGRGNEPGEVTIGDTTPPSQYLSGGVHLVSVPGSGGAVLAQIGRVIMRFTRHGRLDSGFGSGGRVMVPVPVPGAMNVLADGSVLVPGAKRFSNHDEFIIARLRPDGSEDVSFGHRGVREVDVGIEVPPSLHGSPLSTSGCRVVPTPDGGAYVVGSYRYTFSSIGQCDEFGCSTEINPVSGFVVTRIGADGSIDPDFGKNGTIAFRGYDDGTHIVGARLLPSGKLLIATADYSADLVYSVSPRARVSEPIPLCGESTFCESRHHLAAEDGSRFIGFREAFDATAPLTLVRLDLHDGDDPGSTQADLHTFNLGDQPIARFADDGSILVMTVRSDDDAPVLLRRFWPDDSPVATIKARPIVAGSSRSQVIEVTYRDDDPIDPSTFDNRDLRITGPNGFVRYAKFDRIRDDGSDPRRRVVRYKLAAPDGAWDSSDNGEYSLRIRNDQIADVDGNLIMARELGTFRVQIPAATMQMLRVAPVQFRSERVIEELPQSD